MDIETKKRVVDRTMVLLMAVVPLMVLIPLMAAKQKKKVRGASKKSKNKRISFNYGRLLKLIKPLFFLSVALMAVGLSWFSVQQALNVKVKKTVIEGQFVYLNKQQLAQIVNPNVQTGYLTVDLEKIKADLAALEWVRHVSVKRQWPDVIHVSVVEQVPVVRWQGDHYLNDKGDIFLPGEQIDFKFANLHGPDGSQIQLLEKYILLQEKLHDHDIQIAEYLMDSKEAQRIILGNGIELVLGRKDINDKLNRLLKIYHKSLQSRVNEISKIDVRYTNGLAVQWRTSVAEVANNSFSHQERSYE